MLTLRTGRFSALAGARNKSIDVGEMSTALPSDREESGPVPPAGLMRYLTLGEVVALHRAVIECTGGATGLRDLAALESALAQPRATFDGADLHPTITGKAAALTYSLALNHPFVDATSVSPTRQWRCFSC